MFLCINAQLTHQRPWLAKSLHRAFQRSVNSSHGSQALIVVGLPVLLPTLIHSIRSNGAEIELIALRLPLMRQAKTHGRSSLVGGLEGSLLPGLADHR